MSDIFHEVDEEVRREKLKQLWERHGNLIVAVALLVVLAVGGWRGYEWWDGQEGRRIRRRLRGRGHARRSRQAGRGAGGLRQARQGRHVRLPRARALPRGRGARQDRSGGGGEAYDALAADSSLGRAMQDLAAIRAGLILVDTAPLAELSSRLEPLTAADRPFRHTARELLALGAWRARRHRGREALVRPDRRRRRNPAPERASASTC